jgi:hypothetical protein
MKGARLQTPWQKSTPSIGLGYGVTQYWGASNDNESARFKLSIRPHCNQVSEEEEEPCFSYAPWPA